MIGGSGNVMSHVQNTAACAQRCNSNAQCKAYEYSPSEKKCFLVKVQNPTSPGAWGSFNFCSNSKCANGYRYNKGDVAWSNVIGGSGNVMSHVQNTGACAQICNSNAQCKAYEYSPSEKKCFLVKVRNPTSPGAWGSFNFCSKH